jgi:hypothetical protein
MNERTQHLDGVGSGDGNACEQEASRADPEQRLGRLGSQELGDDAAQGHRMVPMAGHEDKPNLLAVRVSPVARACAGIVRAR